MKKLMISLALLTPTAVFAASAVYGVNSLARKLNSIGNVVIVLLIALAVIFIVWNVVRFIMVSGEERAQYRSSILWGIVGLAVILSIWGLVNILLNTFGLGYWEDTPTQEQIQGLVPGYSNNGNSSNSDYPDFNGLNGD